MGRRPTMLISKFILLYRQSLSEQELDVERIIANLPRMTNEALALIHARIYKIWRERHYVKPKKVSGWSSE